MAEKWIAQYSGVVYTPVYDEHGCGVRALDLSRAYVFSVPEMNIGRDVQRVRVGGYIYDGGNLYATEDDARGYWRRDPFNNARRVSLDDYRIAEQ